MNLLPLAALLSLLGVAAPPSPPPAMPTSASGAPAEIRFLYRNPQLQPAQYLLIIQENGNGHYRSENGAAEATSEITSTVEIDRRIQISQPVRHKIFLAAKRNRYFAIQCDTGNNRIAFQGIKTLTYKGADGNGSCAYNWTKNEDIQYVTRIFEAISLTLEEGARLEVDYRHSPLALDTELETLQDFARQGQALDLENIAPILRTISSDDTVLKNAQKKADALLHMAGQD